MERGCAYERRIQKAAEKLLCGITDKQLHELTIWNDILSSVRSGKLRLWEINDEILRIKYFCKEKSNAHLPLPKAIKAACGSMI